MANTYVSYENQSLAPEFYYDSLSRSPSFGLWNSCGESQSMFFASNRDEGEHPATDSAPDFTAPLNNQQIIGFKKKRKAPEKSYGRGGKLSCTECRIPKKGLKVLGSI